ncbi:MAG TPA: RNA 2',3'-cyclic phosphodiesterase [Thermoanaerobaculia bacterium]|nr:RNA 2',3'-cyclic phosphodiesterase [Thermoanaerobaculia bacterium]
MRVFLAIPLPAILQQKIAEHVAPLGQRLPAARYTPASYLHLTLHFFGERSAQHVAEIAVALEPVLAEHRPFELEIEAAGAFPASRPRVLWLGIARSESLLSLHRDVTQALAALGEELEERPYHPHLTLARAKAPWRRGHLETLRDALRELGEESFGVQSIVIFESHLGPGGSRHEKRVELRLSGGMRSSSHGSFQSPE